MTALLQQWLLDHLLTGRVHHMDALELLELLPDESVSAIITDPPYGLANRTFEVLRDMRGRDTRKGTYKAIKEDWDRDVPLEWMQACERKLAPGANVIVFGGKNSIYQTAAMGLKLDWRIVNDVTWEKPDPPPNFTGRMMTESTERMLWFCPDGEKWTYNNAVAKEMGRGKNLRDVWQFRAPHDDRIHPSQKPLDLMERCVKLFTKPGDLVVDLFAGSGTTLEAARRHGRRYLGSDITLEYVKAANKRLSLPITAQMFADGAA